MDRWFMANLAVAIRYSAGAAIEFISEEYRNIACACESERKANAWELAMLRQAAMFAVAIAAENHDGEALALAVNEFKFWAKDAADWAKELLEWGFF